MAQASGGEGERRGRVELTERQREVLRFIAAGKTNPEIGEALGISLDGAKWHVREIMAKLDVSTREEAGEWWLAHEGLRSRIARTLRAIVPASLWLRVGLGVAIAGGGAAVVVGVTMLTGSGEKGTSSSVGARQVTGPILSYTEMTFSGPMVVASPGVVVLTDGTTFQVSLQTRVFSRQEPLVMADLKVGDVVVVGAQRGSDASLVASHVDLLSEPVASAALVQSAGQSLELDGSIRTLGSISALAGTSFQLAYPGGAATVICAQNCAVTRVIDTGPSDLQPGVKITATVTNGVADSIQFVP